MHDIDLESTYGEDGFDSIAPDNHNRFTAQLDGQGYEVQGLYINKPDTDDIGLIKYNDGIISNIGITDAKIIGKEDVGGLVADNYGGEIVNSYVTGSIYGQNDVGGLAGLNSSGKLINSYAIVNVEGKDVVGGLVGINVKGEVINSYATGDVQGEEKIGGLIGSNSEGDITNGYATGDVKGEERIGGLIGVSYEGETLNSYATGDVQGESKVGGLVGYGINLFITNSYTTGDVNGNIDSGYLVGYAGEHSRFNNNYAYEGSKLNDKSINTRSSSDYSIMMREDLYNKDWYAEQEYDNYVWNLDTVDEMCYIQLANIEGQECNKLPTGNNTPYISFEEETMNRNQSIVELGTEIDDFAALQIQARDEEDGIITENIQVLYDGGYNKDVAGIYNVTYSIEDSQGASSQAEIEVQVGYKEIYTCQDLESINDELEYMNDGYILKQNIDCSTILDFTSIGSDDTYFTGIIDGNGHQITNYSSTQG